MTETENIIVSTSNAHTLFKQIGANISTFFTNFKTIEGSIKTEDPVEKEKLAEHKEISDQFDLYLEGEMYTFSAELIANGYNPNPKQFNIFNQGCIKQSSEDSDFLFNLNNILGKVDDELICLWLISHYVPTYTSEINKNIFSQLKNKEQEDLINGKLADPEFSKKLINFIVSKSKKNLEEAIVYIDNSEVQKVGIRYEDQKFFEKFHKHFINAHYLIEPIINNVELKSMLSYKNIIAESQKTFLEKLNKINKGINYTSDKLQNKNQMRIDSFDIYTKAVDDFLAIGLKTEKDKIIAKIKKLNNNEYVNHKIKTDIKEKIIAVQHDLPIEARTILKNIDDKYQLIAKNRSHNDIDTSMMDIDNLYNEKAIGIVSKYILIDDEYKKTLTNSQGKNSEQLMIESLQNIEQTLDKKLKDINEVRLTELSVSQRHTNEIKNRM